MLKCKKFEKTVQKGVTFHEACDIIIVNRFETVLHKYCVHIQKTAFTEKKSVCCTVKYQK